MVQENMLSMSLKNNWGISLTDFNNVWRKIENQSVHKIHIFDFDQQSSPIVLLHCINHFSTKIIKFLRSLIFCS